MIIPARIKSTDCFIQTEISREKIPLLLSKSTLKKAQAVLNLKEVRLRMFNKILISVYYQTDIIQ